VLNVVSPKFNMSAWIFGNWLMATTSKVPSPKRLLAPGYGQGEHLGQQRQQPVGLIGMGLQGLVDLIHTAPPDR
jgi:hypothetical protein